MEPNNPMARGETAGSDENALARPGRIGNVMLQNRLLLGPMAGVTDSPFRRICHEMGAALVATEMVSANAVRHGNRKTRELLDIHGDEHPVSMQLFGADPETMAYAAEALADEPFDLLDINMGCPVPKIVNNGEGSALMRDPARAEAIVRALVRVSSRPVTVKMRAGFTADTVNAPELAKRCEAAGAAAVAVHGRTREQYYAGKADWSVIRRVKEAVSIPVIGNGDVDSPEAARAMQRETGCDYVMIARAARGNPWLFRRILTGGPEPAVRDVYAMMLRHARMQLEAKGDYMGICQMRKHIAWYTSGFPDSAKVRARINQAASFAELKQILDDWADSAERRVHAPV